MQFVVLTFGGQKCATVHNSSLELAKSEKQRRSLKSCGDQYRLATPVQISR